MKTMTRLTLTSGAVACAILGAAAPALAQLGGATRPVAGEPYNVVARSYPGPTQALISWSRSATPVSRYRIERRMAGSKAWKVPATVPDSVSSYIDSGLLPNTAYEYRVSALRDDAVQKSVGQVILTTPGVAATASDYTRAAAPRRVTLQPMSSTDIAVEWKDASPDETGFRIERRDPGQDWRALAVLGPNLELYRDRGLQPATAYQYRVTALLPNGAQAAGLPAAGSTPASTGAAVYYVDAINGSNANPGTEARPWQTIQKAHGTLLPGQTVLVRAGTYTSATNYAVVAINRSGAEGAPITYRNYPGERPLIRTTKGVNNHGIEVRDAAWIVIDGFEIEGHVGQVSYEEAQQQNQLALAYSKLTPPKYIGAIVDSNGISIAGKTVNKTHHITVRNNIVHDTPGGGINANYADYVTIENNRVYGTSAYSPYGTSGISFLAPYNLDSNTSIYKLVAMNNTVSDAKNLFPCNCFGFRQPTDGNGIIIDSFNKHGYTGRTLVANNVVFNNGGRGIHALNTSYGDVFNNTTYQNSQIAITGDGEITMQRSRFMRIWNNIMVARPDRPANVTTQSTDVDFSHNIVFGGNRWSDTPGSVNNRLGTDPRFVATTGDYRFQLAADSPAVDTAFASGVPAADGQGAPRPRGAGADVGALESF